MDNPSNNLDHQEESSPQLSLSTLARFLIGDRKAIQTLAHCPNCWKLGLVFVLSAGFAREYDGESLLYEPWHLLIPLGASLITSGLLFLMVSWVASRRGVENFCSWKSYRTFLGLFWLMAPMAWLYAIPVERWMSAGGAAQVNMNLLGIVALWRVVLIIRVIKIAYGAKSTFHIFSTVMLFSDVVMLVALFSMPTPIWAIMGGVRLTESEQVILNYTMSLKGWGILLSPVFLICFIRALKKEPEWDSPTHHSHQAVKISRGIWSMAIASVLIWIPILPSFQAEQNLRYQIERDLKSKSIDAALSQMSQYKQGDFPPHWDPPPRPGYGLYTPDIDSVMESIANESKFSPWVRELYVSKYLSRFNSRFFRVRSGFDTTLEFLERIPEARKQFKKDYLDYANWILEDSSVSTSVKERVRKIIEDPSPKA